MVSGYAVGSDGGNVSGSSDGCRGRVMVAVVVVFKYNDNSGGEGGLVVTLAPCWLLWRCY